MREAELAGEVRFVGQESALGDATVGVEPGKPTFASTHS
jgi:hypothetical protein